MTLMSPEHLTRTCQLELERAESKVLWVIDMRTVLTVSDKSY